MSNKPITRTPQEWREILTPEQFAVAREGGTERAFTGLYYNQKEPGIYRCVCCQQELFRSNEKYDSGSGWPSFFAPFAPDRIVEKRDHSHGMERVEICCARCDAHLGHVFPDGPHPTGLRYCVNSLSLSFENGGGGNAMAGEHASDKSNTCE